jgi:cytochrome b pre-mRNA-processing protein 3
MLNWLKERQTRTRTAQQLYGAIVAQARQPIFYTDFRVPDTARGRFELITLHVALVLHRLQAEGAETADLARVLGETFVVDMDDNMREMSFSDLAVPREIKKAAAALFDRHTLVGSAGPAPAAGEADAFALRLGQALAYLAKENNGDAIDGQGVARYVRAAAAALAAQPVADLLVTGPLWPVPAH